MTTDRRRSKCLVCERRRCATLFLLSLKCILVLVLLTTHSRCYCRHRFNEQLLETRKGKNNNPFFLRKQMRLLHGVSLFFYFSLLFSLCSHNEQADKTGRVSLSLSRFLIGLDLCFPFHEFCFLVSLLVRVLLRVSRDLSMLFGSDATHLFSLLFLYTELPPLRNLSSFFF